jgi:hypothetical protein
MSMKLIEHLETDVSGRAAFEFLNIPQDYTDLVLKLSGRSVSFGIAGNFLRPNNISANQTEINIIGDSGSTSSTTRSYISAGGICGASNTTANTFSSVSVYMQNYSSSLHKTFVSESAVENNNGAIGTAYNVLYASTWADTAAIQSIYITISSGDTFAQHSSATLYGIKAGSDGITAVS